MPKEITTFYRDADGTLRAVKGELVSLPTGPIQQPGGEIITTGTKLAISADDVMYKFLWENPVHIKFFLRMSAPGSNVVVVRYPNGREESLGTPQDVASDTEAPPTLLRALEPYL